VSNVRGDIKPTNIHVQLRSRTITLSDITPADTIGHIKHKIQEETGIHPHQQLLAGSQSGMHLLDDFTLEHYNIVAPGLVSVTPPLTLSLMVRSAYYHYQHDGTNLRRLVHC
jgi:hypothetical protein